MQAGARVRESPAGGGACDAVDTMAFIARSQRMRDRFVGIELSGERVRDIRCYLTGPPAGGGELQVDRHYISDKHGFSHTAFNAKMNIHRGGGGPIYLGIQAVDWADFDASITGLGPDPLPPPGAVAPGALRSVATT